MSEKWERWNKEELRILKKHYPNMPREDLMQLLLGRTWRSICNTANTYGIVRPRYVIPRSKQYLEYLHDQLSIARRRRIAGYAPFAGNHHSADSKLAISASNLYTRGHSIKDIAKRKDVTEEEVRKIIENKDSQKKERKNYDALVRNPYAITFEIEEEENEKA